jgi:hypothetical protein
VPAEEQEVKNSNKATIKIDKIDFDFFILTPHLALY